MNNTFRRFLALMLMVMMVVSMLPTAYAQENATLEDEVVVFTEEDYADINDLFAQIDKMEDVPEKSASEAQLADAAAKIVMAADNYVEGSLERNGNSFTWWTEEGIRCVYSPRIREIEEKMVPTAEPTDYIYNEPVATKGGWPSGNQVYLIGPYYGYDSEFTDQYKNEAKSIATAIGDTDGYTEYSGTAATVDKVAEAVSNGAVVIFDSHGSTDYENGYDYVSGATSSYLCLKSKTGLTNEDYNDGALYTSDGIWINGATIANHMTKQSPAGILWMAICLGMATDTFAVPMREMGVEVVYGYSQSVTFAGDYLFEETFWDNMCAGKDVATSIAAMKNKWGTWDWSTQIAKYYGYNDGYSSISAARADYSAFPIVVSDEDAHPGQRKGTTNYGADSLQTVKSTYTLFSQYNVTAQSSNHAYGTVSASGNTITAVPATGYFAESATVISGSATVSQNGNIFSVNAESDCVVQINFAPKTAVVVSFSGASVAAQNGYAGDAMTLPTVTAPEGFKFLGWTTSALSSDTTEKPSFYTDSFVPTGNTTLYALYSYVDENSGSGTGDYVKVTSTPDDWSGEYVIVYEASGYILNSSLSSLDAKNNYKQVTINNQTIDAKDADPYKFVIAAVSGGYSIQTVNGTYISGSSGANKLNTGTSPAANTLSIDASGNATIISNTSHLRFNTSDSRFRYYKSGSYSSQKAIALYVKDGAAGTTYYTSTPIKCEHINTENVAEVAPTCTEHGYTAGVQCADCGTVISGIVVVDALGHSWSNWTEITAPNCTTAGEQSRVCTSCGETQTQPVSALGHSWGVWTQTVAPSCTAAGEQSSTCSLCGASQTQSVAALGHSYADGACEVCGEAEPESAGDRYYIAALRNDVYFYMTSDLGTGTTSRYQADDTDLKTIPNVITNPEDDHVFVLVENDDGTYSIQAEGVSGDNFLGWTSGNSGILVAEDKAVKASIDATGGVYNIHFAASDAERYLSLNGTAGNNFFAWYKAGQIKDLVLIPVAGEGTSVPETTLPNTSEPEATEPVPSQPASDVLTIAEANALGGSMAHNTYTSQKYKVTGVIVDVYNTQYGNMHITDGNGNTLTIYGTFDATGTNRYDAMAVKPVAGDTVAIYGVVGQYNGTPQIKNGWIIEHIPAEPEATEPTPTEPAPTETTPTEPVPSEPETTKPTGTTTELQYVFSKYAAGTQYAQGEEHVLDDVVTLTINGAHLNSQIRLYAGSNAVFASKKVIDSIVVKAGNKVGTLNVYGSDDGASWDLITTQKTTTTYTDYSIDMGGTYRYLKLESVGAQIRVSEMTINVIEPGAEEPLVAGVDMVISDDLNMNFHLNTRTDVVITIDGESVEISADDLVAADNGKFIATVSVAAAQMTDEITVSADGKVAGTYTIRQYADKILADDTYEKYHDLVKEMLNYGGYAQSYFAHNTNNLANAGITGVGAEDVPAAAAQDVNITGSAEGVRFHAASLVYKDKVAVRFYFEAKSIEGLTFTANGNTYEAVAKGDYYVVEVPTVNPSKLDQQITVAVTDAEGGSLTVSYGPMNYIVRMNAKGDESLKALLKALYNYHLAAKVI